MDNVCTVIASLGAPSGRSVALVGIQFAAALAIMAVGAMLTRNSTPDVKSVLDSLPSLPVAPDTEDVRERNRDAALREFRRMIGWRAMPGLVVVGLGFLMLVWAFHASLGDASVERQRAALIQSLVQNGKIEQVCRTGT